MFEKALQLFIFLFSWFSLFLSPFSRLSFSSFFSFSLIFLPFFLFSVLYHHTLPIAFTLLCEGFHPVVWMEQTLSQKVLQTALRHPAYYKGKSLRCQYSARIGELLIAIWFLGPQRVPVTSVSVSLVGTWQGTTSDLRRLLWGFINQNTQKLAEMLLQNKVPLIEREKTRVQTCQRLQKAFNRNVFTLQADLYSLGSL